MEKFSGSLSLLNPFCLVESEVDPTVRTIFDAGEERVVRLGYAA